MPTYLYCLVGPEAGVAVDGLAGIDGGVVRLLRAPPVVALVGDVNEGGLAPTAERIRAHDAVVRRALEVTTPLPARFGQLFPDDRAAAASIAARGAKLEQAMELVQGCVEMTVRVLFDDTPTIAGKVQEAENPTGAPILGAGRRYLLELQDRQRVEHIMLQRARLAQAKVADVVGKVVRMERLAAPAGESRTAVISHLIRRDSVAMYRDALRDADIGGLVLSGPWAPYSFAGDGDVG